MIFQRAALREFTHTAAGVFVALFAILLTAQLIRLLGQAAGGKITPEAVFALMGFSTLGFLPVILSLTLFISVLLPISRAYRESEMTAWFSCGLSLSAWFNPVLKFALPVIAVIATLSFFLTPWALTQSMEYRQRIDNRDDIARITPGSFRESANAERVFFVEEISATANRIQNIFVSLLQQGKQGVVLAAQGYTEVSPKGDRFLVMENGRRYETRDDSAEYTMMAFERYAVRIEPREQRQLDSKPKNMSTTQLLRTPTPANLGELLWRIGIPLGALTLALFAIPLAFINPRAGRSNNFLFALVIYVTYNNLLSLAQARVIQGKLSFGVGAWLVHGMMLIALLLMFWHRQRLNGWRRWWR